MKENVLRKVDGPFVAQASQQLPDVEKCKDQFVETVMDMPLVGRLRFRFQRMVARQGKNRRWFWCAVEAFDEDQ